jgi:5-methylcytosine-specific restriction endonuclease McrA
MKRSPLAPVSRKRARLLRERRKVTDAMKAEGDVLCVRCGRMADDPNEILSRARGGSIVDRENIVPLCRPCHSFITDNPRAAHAEGLSKHSWEGA